MIELRARPLLLDRAVIFVLYLMAMIPFAQAVHFNVGIAILNAYEVFLLALCVIFVVLIVKRGMAKQYVGFVFLVIAMFFIYSIYSLLFIKVGFSSWVTQTRKFLPFMVACMALLTRLYMDRVRFINGLAFSVSFSALVAIIIHLFFKDFVEYAFSASEEVSRVVVEGGRMYWGSSTLAFFGLAALMINRRNKKKVLLVFALMIVLAGSLFTQNRTMLVGLLIFYVGSQKMVFNRAVKPFIYISFASVIGAGVFYFLASDEMVALLQRRLLLAGAAHDEIAHSFTDGRVSLYVQYLDRFLASFPFGQGLGLPLAYGLYSEVPVFTADISLVSFGIPFGFLGLVIFLIFIFRMFWSFRIYKNAAPFDKLSQVLILLLFSSCFVSLNIDLFSRNIFVVYLAVFAVIHFVPSLERVKMYKRGGWLNNGD